MKAVIVLGLGFGDEGKGTIVDSLTRAMGSKLTVRFNGGFQAAHNVYTETKNHTFSQFGSGTFAGADTLIGPEVVVNPLAMQVEAMTLQTKGVTDPLKKIWISRECLVTTPFHKALNQIRELSRGKAHGSTGSGIGETVRASYVHLTGANTILRVKNVVGPTFNLVYSLRMLFEQMQSQCLELIHDYELEGEAVNNAMAPFTMDDCINKLMQRYAEWAGLVNVVKTSDNSFQNRLRNETQPVIFEGAQGVLLDQVYGFHPYTTWSHTTDVPARALLKSEDTVRCVGVTRAFFTRHGAGPFVTEHPDCSRLVEDDDNSHGQFQGSLRAGHLDLVALKYAIKCCYKVNALAVTHCDKLDRAEAKKVCIAYEGADLLNYSAGEASPEAFKFTKKLLRTKPLLTEPADLLAFVEQELKLPIIITSHGKTHKLKKYMGLQPDDAFVALPKKSDVAQRIVEMTADETTKPAAEVTPKPEAPAEPAVAA